MPKPFTFPTLLDNANQVNISLLKKWGYLKSNHRAVGNISWSVRGKSFGDIDFILNTKTDHPYIRLIYNYGNEPRNYKVYLFSQPSNLGIGEVWYFICPRTDKLCRKLYCVDGYFYHREAFNNCMYESQTQSKKYRAIEKQYGAYFDSDKLYSQLHKKHFKKTYNGQPTKRYKKIMEQLAKAEKVEPWEIERLMLL